MDNAFLPRLSAWPPLHVPLPVTHLDLYRGADQRRVDGYVAGVAHLSPGTLYGESHDAEVALVRCVSMHADGSDREPAVRAECDRQYSQDQVDVKTRDAVEQRTKRGHDHEIQVQSALSQCLAFHVKPARTGGPDPRQ